MDAIKKQASKLREQVAKQQQAILRQLGKESSIFDDAELQSHEKVKKLYNSTTEAKHFQRDIVRGVESFVSITKKQLEIAKMLAENCCKYGTQNQSIGSPLARAVLEFGNAHGSIEDAKETMLGIFVDQVSEPLQSLMKGAPLEDARHLTHRYERLLQGVEAQAADISRRQSRSKEPFVENAIKLKNAEAMLAEHRASMIVLQREAIAAMLSVEDHQQQLTFQKLLTMPTPIVWDEGIVDIDNEQIYLLNIADQQQESTQFKLLYVVDAERSYHLHASDILEELLAKMILEMQLNESSWKPETIWSDADIRPACEDTTLSGSDDQATANERDDYFIAKVLHAFDAQADGELSLAVDDYVAVSQVAPNGWSEGKCMGRAGWFPSAYVERHDRDLINTIEK